MQSLDGNRLTGSLRVPVDRTVSRLRQIRKPPSGFSKIVNGLLIYEEACPNHGHVGPHRSRPASLKAFRPSTALQPARRARILGNV